MPWETILSLIGMLVAVVAVMVLAYWTTRWIGRYGTSGTIGGLGDPRLSVLCQLRVGKDEQLVLVRLRERCLLLGVTAGGITLLRELSGEEAEEWIAEREKAASGQTSFLEVLRKTWPGKK